MGDIASLPFCFPLLVDVEEFLVFMRIVCCLHTSSIVTLPGKSMDREVLQKCGVLDFTTFIQTSDSFLLCYQNLQCVPFD